MRSSGLFRLRGNWLGHSTSAASAASGRIDHSLIGLIGGVRLIHTVDSSFASDPICRTHITITNRYAVSSPDYASRGRRAARQDVRHTSGIRRDRPRDPHPRPACLRARR